MTCSSCGAAMRLKEDAEYLICDYCSNVYFPEPNADGVRVLTEATICCSICAVTLSHAAISGHRIMYCGRCRGMLISMEAFSAVIQDLRARRAGTADAARQPDWRDMDRRLKCPQCGEMMETHPYYGPGNVIIDDCERCLMNWLDYSELERIVRAPDKQYAS